MRRRELLLSGLAALSAGTAQADVKIGKPAPVFEVKTLTGQTINSQTLRGKVVLLNFWATWCAPCRAEMPALDAYYKAHKADGFEIITISQDEAHLDAKVAALAADFSFPVAFSRNAKVEGFGRIWHLPISFIIDRDGILRLDGSRKPVVFDAAKLDQLVTPLLKAVSPLASATQT